MPSSGVKWPKVGNRITIALIPRTSPDQATYPKWGSPSMFTGEYRHSVDDKGRLAVPSRFRAQLDGGSVVSRWLDACLAILTRAGWDALAEKVPTLPITDANARRFSRFIFAGAVESTLDRQGRVLLPRLPPGHGRAHDRRGRRRNPRSRRDLGSRHVGDLPPGPRGPDRPRRSDRRSRDLGEPVRRPEPPDAPHALPGSERDPTSTVEER